MLALGLDEIHDECRKAGISAIPSGSCNNCCHFELLKVTHFSSYTWLVSKIPVPSFMLCADQVSASDSGLLPGDSLVTSSQMQQF